MIIELSSRILRFIQDFFAVDSKFEGEVWENLDRSLMTIEVRYKPLLRIVSRSIVGLRMMSQQGI